MNRLEKIVVALIVASAVYSIIIGTLLIWNLTTLTDIRGRVVVLYEMHDRVDDDGIPLWYVPRGSIAELREIRQRMEINQQMIEEILDAQ